MVAVGRKSSSLEGLARQGLPWFGWKSPARTEGKLSRGSVHYLVVDQPRYVDRGECGRVREQRDCVGRSDPAASVNRLSLIRWLLAAYSAAGSAAPVRDECAFLR